MKQAWIELRSVLVVCLSILLGTGTSVTAFAQTSAVPAPRMINLIVIEGEGAINNIKQRTAREAVVQVEDENHRPIAGALVTFTTPGQGPSGAFLNGARSLTVTSDSQGRAVARGLRPNTVQGKVEIRVNAKYQGAAADAIITMTNMLPAGAAAASGISVKLITILAVAGAAAAGIAVAATRGGGGGSPPASTTPPTTTTPNPPVAIIIAPGTPSAGGPH